MADVDRGMSTVVGYVLNVGIATLLITGLIFASGNLVEDQRERAIRSEFGVLGNRIAADLETADRLSRVSDGGEVRLSTQLPEYISGKQYEISLESDGDDVDVVLHMDGPEVTVRVSVNNSTAIEPNTVEGGALEIYRSGSNPLEVTNE